MTAPAAVRPQTPYGLRLLPMEFARRFGRPAAGVWRAPAAAVLLASAEAVLTVPLEWGAAVAADRRADHLVEVEHELRPAERLVVPAPDGPPPPRWTRAALAVVGAAGAGHGTSLLLRADLPPGLVIGPDPAVVAVLGRVLWDLHRTPVDLDGPASTVCASRWERVAVTTARCGRDRHAMLVDPETGSAVPVPFDLRRAGLRLLLADPGGAAPAAAGAADGGPPDRVHRAALLLRSGDLPGFGRVLTEQYRSVAAARCTGTPVGRAVEAALRAGALGAGLLGAGPAHRGRPMIAALAGTSAVRAVRAAVHAELGTAGPPAPRYLTATACRP
ncbi:hypothetical protein [Jidongwangia harbinensis]|uniref:hypothetical protein n=1 Tax=Jidongwangia harbinensis TaxID=2878561 RepID=UPI001CDA143A|nr:hypothetical protein [Jidongwangia harbinensis]MCA2215050.1 hypothetical protein [Jidongwangia harbinensis]